MRKAMILMVLVVSMFSANALCFGNVQVSVEDDMGFPLEGVVVAPEFKSIFGGWNDMVPKEHTTNSAGIAKECSWIVAKNRQIQVNYAELDGYTCTRGEDTRKTSVNDMNTLKVVCTPNEVPDAPEFGVIGATLALAGIGIFLYKRR